MKPTVTFFLLFLCLGFLFPRDLFAASTRPPKTPISSPTASASSTPTQLAIPTPITSISRPDITQKSEASVSELEKIIQKEKVGPIWKNPLKYLIAKSVSNGVPANTIVLLLLLPLVAAFVAGARHLVGLQGFGILLPTALSIAFLAVGPMVGIGLFLVIVGSSIGARSLFRKFKFRLHYLPRMSLILLISVLALMVVLLLGSSISLTGITNVSIFPVLFLVVLSEDFTRVQLGKSFRTALNITNQTLLLALASYFFLTLWELQKFAIENPETLMIFLIFLNIILGKFSGLRVLEYYRFRKLIKKL